MSEATVNGLTHKCDDPDCHVPGFVHTLTEHMPPASPDAPGQREPSTEPRCSNCGAKEGDPVVCAWCPTGQREADAGGEVERVLRENGLTDRPAEYDSNIHSWRCEYPDRYGPCDCFAELVAQLASVVAAARAETDEWKETAQTFCDDYHAEVHLRIDAETALAAAGADADARLGEVRKVGFIAGWMARSRNVGKPYMLPEDAWHAHVWREAGPRR